MITKKIFPTLLLCLLMATLTTARAQYVNVLKQQKLSKWGVLPANYSGITRIEGNTYAVIDDKSAKEGFYLFDIEMDLDDGKILSVVRSGLFGPANPEYNTIYADCEGVVYVPTTKTIFICQERYGQVREYNLRGELTGRRLEMPSYMAVENHSHNGGLESLAYDTASHTFWTTTENPLNTDKSLTTEDGKTHQPHRIVSFGDDLKPLSQWAYLLDAPQLSNDVKYYAHGISEITALPDGRLLVMERELSVPDNYLGSKCAVAIYVVNPRASEPLKDATPLNELPSDVYMVKQHVASFTTRITVNHLNYANYEGMCLGPRLNDGRQTLLLLNDSQAGAGNSLYKLKDYIKVIILPSNF